MFDQAVQRIKRDRTQYHVAPRYTPGSPAQVDEATALRVAEQELEAWGAAMSGTLGEAEQKRAAMLRLAGIVESLVERKRDWLVYDLITDRVFARPFPENVPSEPAQEPGRRPLRAAFKREARP